MNKNNSNYYKSRIEFLKEWGKLTKDEKIKRAWKKRRLEGWKLEKEEYDIVSEIKLKQWLKNPINRQYLKDKKNRDKYFDTDKFDKINHLFKEKYKLCANWCCSSKRRTFDAYCKDCRYAIDAEANGEYGYGVTDDC